MSFASLLGVQPHNPAILILVSTSLAAGGHLVDLQHVHFLSLLDALFMKVVPLMGM